MAEPIVGHGTTVAPEALWSAVAALDRCIESLRHAWRQSCAVGTVAPGLSHEIAAVIQQATTLRSQLEQCIRAYSAAEAEAEQQARSAASVWSWWAGYASHFGMIFPAFWLSATALHELPWRRRDRVAPILRLGVESADDVMLGLAGIAWVAQRADAPSWLSRQLATDGDANSSVRVAGAGAVAAPPPASVTELVERIPDSNAQIRIESYGTGTERSWVVYVAGTRSQSLGGSEPFDMRSNLAVVGNAPAASQRAVEQAMAQAGVRSGDRVMLVGHSQGGMVAARIAETGRYRVEQCVTVGAPLGTIASTVPTLAIEHRQDPVPALAGETEPSAARLSYRTDAPPTADQSIIGPHALSQYEQTAGQIDRSTDPALAEIEARIRSFAACPGTAVEFTATRAPN